MSLRIITLNNIGSELEAKEMESWIRLIRVMTHEIMNSIAPITSLSESLLFSFRSRATEMAGNSLYLNTVDALETINATTKGLLNFVESYRQFTRIPQPQIVPLDTKQLLGKVIHLCSPKMGEAGVEAKVILEGDISVLYADENQVLQVLVNLVKKLQWKLLEGKKEGLLLAGRLNWRSLLLPVRRLLKCAIMELPFSGSTPAYFCAIFHYKGGGIRHRPESFTLYHAFAWR